MNDIAAHVEFLLHKHDCVVLPGFGALLCNYVPAHFDADDGRILNPPGRSLAFNGLLSESDGLLAASIARKDGIPYEAAVGRMNEEIEMLRCQLARFGELQLGRLGRFHIGEEGQLGFTPCQLPSINGYFYGLQPVVPAPLAAEGGSCVAAAEPVAVSGDSVVVPGRMGWGAYAIGVVASLAVLVTVALFMFSPIRIDRPTQTASIAPVPAIVEEPADVAPLAAGFVGIASEAIRVTEPTGIEICPEETEAPVAMEAPVEVAVKTPAVEQVVVQPRFNDGDSYCVIVASFPTRTQAEEYMNQHAGRKLGILEKDAKFRVFAATADSYRGANEQKAIMSQADAWVCRR